MPEAKKITAQELIATTETPPATVTPPAEPAPDPAPTATSPAATVTAPAAPTPPAGEVDRNGRPFDAKKFHPRKDSLGRWVNKNGGRRRTFAAQIARARALTSPTAEPPKSFVAPDATTAPAAPAAPAAAPATPGHDRFDLAADLYARSFYSVADSVFAGSGEWLPDDDAEHAALRASLAAYLRHKGTDDLPPGWALTLAAGTYSAKRLQRPKTSTRLRFYAAWLRAKLGSLLFSFRAGKVAPLSPPPPPAQVGPLPPFLGNAQATPAANSTP